MHRLCPSLTIICHSTKQDVESDYDLQLWPDKNTRPHDAPITDLLLPVASTEAILLELELGNEKAVQDCKITIISSPYRCCLQTAAVIAHKLNLTSIDVNYDLCDTIEGIQSSGYDRYYTPLYLSQSGMQASINRITERIEPITDIRIRNITGDPPSLDEDDCIPRMIRVYDEISTSLHLHGEHCIIVTHPKNIEAAVYKYKVG